MRLWLSGGEQLLICASSCPHSSSSSSPLSSTIPQSWTDHTTRQTHGRPQTTSHGTLSRLALKSVRAAKKDSVAKCAGPLQYGVGRPDGANTMINTIQFLAEADNSRVLVARDLKAAFQNASRVEPCCTAPSKTMRVLQLSSPCGTLVPLCRMHYDSACTQHQCQQWC